MRGFHPKITIEMNAKLTERHTEQESTEPCLKCHQKRPLELIGSKHYSIRDFEI